MKTDYWAILLVLALFTDTNYYTFRKGEGGEPRWGCVRAAPSAFGSLRLYDDRTVNQIAGGFQSTPDSLHLSPKGRSTTKKDKKDQLKSGLALASSILSSTRPEATQAFNRAAGVATQYIDTFTPISLRNAPRNDAHSNAPPTSFFDSDEPDAPHAPLYATLAGRSCDPESPAFRLRPFKCLPVLSETNNSNLNSKKITNNKYQYNRSSWKTSSGENDQKIHNIPGSRKSNIIHDAVGELGHQKIVSEKTVIEALAMQSLLSEIKTEENKMKIALSYNPFINQPPMDLFATTENEWRDGAEGGLGGTRVGGDPENGANKSYVDDTNISPSIITNVSTAQQYNYQHESNLDRTKNPEYVKKMGNETNSNDA